MPKLNRVRLKNSAGGGRGTHDSDLFYVVHWMHQRNVGALRTTTIEFYTPGQRRCSIRFHGHVDFGSDRDCISQLYPGEILLLMKAQEEKWFEKGRKDKIKELRQVLEYR